MSGYPFTFELKRSYVPGAFPGALSRGEPFYQIADGFILIGDGQTPPSSLPRYALLPPDAINARLSKAANLSDLTDKAAALAVLEGAPLSSVVRTDVGQTLDAVTRRRIKASIGAFGTGYGASLSGAATLTGDAIGSVIYLYGGINYPVALPTTLLKAGQSIKFFNIDSVSKTITSTTSIYADGTWGNSYTIRPYETATVECFLDDGQAFVFSGAPMKLFEDAWTAYTPTVSFGSGAANNISVAGKYKKIGKTVHYTINLNIYDKGSAGSIIVLSLPFTQASSIYAVANGSEIAVTGASLSCYHVANNGSVYIRMFDGSSAVVNGYALVISGTYETN